MGPSGNSWIDCECGNEPWNDVDDEVAERRRQAYEEQFDRDDE